MKLKLILFLAILFNIAANATTIEGVVIDQSTKEPIIGASVQVKGTSLGTVTDFDGKFKLNVDDTKSAVLIISYVGYQRKSLSLDGRTLLTIPLEEDTKTLDEVVVVGYGTMRKSDLTGSLTSVKASQEEAMVNTSFDRMLQGKAAGVMVTTSSSAPGGAVNILVRGTSSLRGDNQPLYVVDGNIIDVDQTENSLSSGTGGGNSLSAAQNPLSSISTQDIENIEILKDASATAIYGSRGANGVVLITTKQGNTAKPVVTFSSVLTTSMMSKKIDVLNTTEYVDFWNKMNPGSPLDITTLNGVNWQDFSTRNAFSQNYRASVSAKSGKTSYYLSAGYMDNQGIIKNTGISQADVRLNLNQEINKSISLQTSTSFSNLKTSMTAGTDKLSSVSSSLITNMILKRPYKGALATENELDINLIGPEAWFLDYDDDSNDTQFSTNATLNINITRGLKLQLKEGIVYRDKNRYVWNGPLTTNGNKTNGQAGHSGLKNWNTNSEALLQYNNKINKSHNLNATLGVVYQTKKFSSNSLTGENFISKDLRAKGISLAQTLYPYMYTESGEQMFSALGRLVYSYRDRYIFTGTFRADGSSKFSADNKFSYFPSFAFAWRANEETFLKNVSEISNLKFRAGWGQVGNQAIKPYQTLQSYYTNYYTAADGSLVVGLSPSRIPNPDLKWETSEQYNIGLDLGLFDQRISITVDAFSKETKDLLQEKSISGSSGYTSMWINNGKVQNRGLEFTLDAKVLDKKNFKINVGGNISFVQNKILDLGMPVTDFGMLKGVSGYLGDNLGNNNNIKMPVNIFLVGRSIGQFFGYQTEGILQAGETQNFNGTTLSEGNIKLKDLSGDGVVNEEDRTILGNPNPKFTYAFNVNMSYRNWGLDMIFNGVQGNNLINANLIDQTDVSNAIKNVLRDAYYNAYDATNNPTGTYPALGSKPLGVLTDRMIEDGSYLRLSNVTLSYRLRLPKIKAINSITFSGTANNVFVLTKYTGYDPDVNSFANDADRMGVDLASYPATRSFVLGITANF